eukprot:TRINITY_DN2851_c0_g1::TRINITY_DN2851_c0_g1_i3::g.5369::m.5369 TRINITY_DN2851_c0_g1::TRINITY_DN2851_c0_g1_i3::g.5369  ORF type:complete len:128 (+),score=0.97,zf-C3HC4_4/PF15227.1/3e+03,zf-C3HC4_4/PF15227.1/1.7e-05,zf-C3HC4_2/PF13923.1/3.5e+03,zf-C3HC4_2/PF13923.1/7.1e+03,zf-C3HC4_2/PF13923.1/4.6e-05,zf-RING_UBOX/PF13445.1/3.6e+03,zf-RING_UBOX/PF13445.1/0.00075,zf-RING_5/PF14634.1/4.9e+02,zf-RING_5/PF14634.1/2.8e+03,zf-RING_5/PF14634.1/0.0011,zf-C3HC4_3/PF13920.1/3.3e+02,zf-C3HC4_3/PF13920.1/1.3e
MCVTCATPRCRTPCPLPRQALWQYYPSRMLLAIYRCTHTGMNGITWRWRASTATLTITSIDPVILRCGHTFCLRCAKILVFRDSPAQNDAESPRQGKSVTASSVDPRVCPRNRKLKVGSLDLIVLFA